MENDGMTNLPTIKTEIAAPTPQHAQSLSQQELDAHRAEIAFNVEVVLDGYWDRMPPDNVKAAILADWADTLEDWTQEQIVWALRKWRNENPNKRPNAGHILALMKEARGKKIAAQVPKQEQDDARERVSADRAAEIMAQAGFNIRRFPK